MAFLCVGWILRDTEDLGVAVKLADVLNGRILNGGIAEIAKPKGTHQRDANRVVPSVGVIRFHSKNIIRGRNPSSCANSLSRQCTSLSALPLLIRRQSRCHLSTER